LQRSNDVWSLDGEIVSWFTLGIMPDLPIARRHYYGGKSFEDMLKHLSTVFDRLEDASLKLKAKKRNLFARRVVYLGHVITSEGVAADPEKLDTVAKWPVPTNVTEVRSFLGLCSYYLRFIEHFSGIAKPLHRLTEKERVFVWTEEYKEAFETLRSRLVSAPILALPDFSLPFILDTDASKEAIGAVLSQSIEGKEKVIVYAMIKVRTKLLRNKESAFCKAF